VPCSCPRIPRIPGCVRNLNWPEAFRSGKPVLLDLSQLDEYGSTRLVDFAAGLAFSAHGDIERTGDRTFLLPPLATLQGSRTLAT
jgi:hypothetical protein